MSLTNTFIGLIKNFLSFCLCRRFCCTAQYGAPHEDCNPDEFYKCTDSILRTLHWPFRISWPTHSNLDFYSYSWNVPVFIFSRNGENFSLLLYSPVNVAASQITVREMQVDELVGKRLFIGFSGRAYCLSFVCTALRTIVWFCSVPLPFRSN